MDSLLKGIVRGEKGVAVGLNKWARDLKKPGEILIGASLSGRREKELNSVTKDNQHGGMVRERVGLTYRLFI